MIPTEQIEQWLEEEKEGTSGTWKLDSPLNPQDISVWVETGEFLGNCADVSVDDDGAIIYSPAYDLQRVADAQLIVTMRNNWRRVLEELKDAYWFAREINRYLMPGDVDTPMAARIAFDELRKENERLKRDLEDERNRNPYDF